MPKVWPYVVGAAFVSSAAFVVSGVSRDGQGELSVDIGGEYQSGDCAKLLDLPETKNPATPYQLLENIKQIGRLCGYYYHGNTVGFEGVTYDIRIDPETMDLNYDAGDESSLGVTAYMELSSEQAQAPAGYLYTAMDANPGVCAAAVLELGTNMKEYFNEAFDEQIAQRLIPDVHIAPDSNHPCEAAGATQPAAVP